MSWENLGPGILELFAEAAHLGARRAWRLPPGMQAVHYRDRHGGLAASELERTRECAGCGAEFRPTNDNQAHCRERCRLRAQHTYCRAAAWRKLARGAALNDNASAGQCSACGAATPAALHFRDGSYCSRRCLAGAQARFRNGGPGTVRAMATPYKLTDAGAPSAGATKLPDNAQPSPPVKQVLDEAASTGRGVDDVAAGIASANEPKPLAWGPDKPTENGAKPFKLG
jgi:hypothetical protein